MTSTLSACLLTITKRIDVCLPSTYKTCILMLLSSPFSTYRAELCRLLNEYLYYLNSCIRKLYTNLREGREICWLFRCYVQWPAPYSRLDTFVNTKRCRLPQLLKTLFRYSKITFKYLFPQTQCTLQTADCGISVLIFLFAFSMSVKLWHYQCYCIPKMLIQSHPY